MPDVTYDFPINEALAGLAEESVPKCSLYEHENFNTNDGDDDGWEIKDLVLAIKHMVPPRNDNTSSIIVHSGRWRFYEHDQYGGEYIEFGVGYHNVPDGWNDRISSCKPANW